jgi:lysophospholipase
MNLLEGFLYGKEDTKIFYRKDIPSSSRAIVVIAHGYMEHSGRYIAFAKELVKENIGVCIIDHRGNGKSEGERGDIEDFFDFVEDFHRVISSLRCYQKPIFTFGHSMGGLITFLYGLKYPKLLTGQIFSSPALGVPIGCKNLPDAFYEGIGHLLPELKIHRVAEELATKNRYYRKIFKEDKVPNEYATARFMDQFLRVGVNYGKEHAKEYELKSLFLLGEKDLVIPIDRNHEILQQIVFEGKEIIEYPNCMHDLLHEVDEIVNKVIADLIGWLGKALQSSKKED